jgi:hypothetical protein
MWQREFSSSESAHKAYSTTYGSFSTTTSLKKLPYYNNYNLQNKGILWKRNTTARTYGSVAAQVYHNSNLSGMDWSVKFEYVIPGSVFTDDSKWYANVSSLLFNYYGITLPQDKRYGTTSTIRLP